jgi:integrase
MKVNRYLVSRHLSGPLKGKRLLDITPMFLEKLVLKMSKDGSKARTINTTLQALRVPYAYFCRQHRLANALTSIEKVAEAPKERGILTADEIGKVIALEGESPRAVAGVLLGALCGLRLGEARGLQWEDIDETAGTIHICHNAVDATEGLKGPKWGSVREVPAPAPVLDALKLCADVSPWGRSGYVLWNDKASGQPIAHGTLPAGFKRILRSIGISDAMRKERNLCFHGLRHTFVSLTRAASIPDFIVQRMAGHKSMDMTNRYSHTEGIIDFAAARASIEAAVSKKAIS